MKLFLEDCVLESPWVLPTSVTGYDKGTTWVELWVEQSKSHRSGPFYSGTYMLKLELQIFLLGLVTVKALPACSVLGELFMGTASHINLALQELFVDVSSHRWNSIRSPYCFPRSSACDSGINTWDQKWPFFVNFHVSAHSRLEAPFCLTPKHILLLLRLKGCKLAF